MPIDDSFTPKKKSRYTPDTFTYNIYVVSENSVSNLTDPYEYPQVSIITSDAPNIDHIITRDKYGYVMENIGYCSRWNAGIICHKNIGYIDLRALLII